MKHQSQPDAYELCEPFLLLKTKEEAYAFLKDLCTPQELEVLTERWRVCKLLHQDELSYREIHRISGASLTTIGRVARFLKIETNRGYLRVLKRMKK